MAPDAGKECPTGIPGFDEVTRGGFFRGQLVLIAGNAGSGKTTFAAKFLYEGAKSFGEPGLMISTGETLKDFLFYMGRLGLDFEPLMEKGLFRFVELPAPTSDNAILSLSEKLVKEATGLGAKRIVIDSITPVFAFNPPPEVRAVLRSAIKTLASTLGATVLVTVEVPRGEMKLGVDVEEFVADAVIRLNLVVPKSGAPYRVMEVLKLRGRPLGRAKYQYDIGPPYGFRVHLPGVVEELTSCVCRERRLTTGVRGLDELLEGGFIRGTAVLIVGPPGSGKTLLSLTAAAENVLRGERAVVVNFEEPRQQIEETLRFLGYNPEELKQKGLKILALNPRAATLIGTYSLISGLLEEDPALLVLDGVTSLRREFGAEFSRMVRSLAMAAKKKGTTSILVLLNDPRDKPTFVSAVADTLIELRLREYEGRLTRELAVVKARMSRIDTRYRELVLDERGLRVR